MPIFGALGDIHGDFAAARRVMERHDEVPFWLCVGDVGNDEGHYEALPSPLYWIKGNNESFDAIAAGGFPRGLHYVPNAQLATIDGVRIAGLGGTLAPTWFDTPAADLPHPPKRTAQATAQADKRRHFVREEVEACRSLRGRGRVPDARGAAAVPDRTDRGRQAARERRAGGHAAAAAPVRAPSPVHRAGL